MNLQSISRFAPSPTGRLHLGHAFSAIRAHDLAREAGGRFLLRIEDIDPGRSREAFVAGIEEDLDWLGLAWDGPVLRQSARTDAYRAALERAGRGGAALSLLLHARRHRRRRERAARAGWQRRLSRHLPWPRSGRTGAADGQRALRVAARHGARHRAARAGRAGMMPSWARSTPTPLRFGDVVLARKDAPASYHLAVTVDDACAGCHRRRARHRPVRGDARPPPAPGAARPADAPLPPSPAAHRRGRAVVSPSATARRRWPICALRAPIRARWWTRCGPERSRLASASPRPRVRAWRRCCSSS